MKHAISELLSASNSTRVFAPNFYYDKKFDLHKSELVGGTHFHMNGFPQRLVLILRQKTTWKWSIDLFRKRQPTACFARA